MKAGATAKYMEELPEYDFYIYSIIESNLLKLPLTQFLDEIVNAGVSIIQLRDKFATNRERYETAKIIKNFIDKKDISFIINDSIDLALAVGADGVHLGVKDIPIDIAKANFSNLLFGYSCNSLNDMNVANRYADYAGVGPCYHTDTKIDLRNVLSIEEVTDIVDSAKVKTFAIGGIDDKNLKDILKSGIDGVVLASYLLKSETPYHALNKLMDIYYERI